MTRVKTNVAAKIKDENPAPDFSREEPQSYTGAPATYSVDTKAWEARLRRLSALFTGDPFIFDSDVSLSIESDNRYYTNSDGSQIVTGDLTWRIFIQGMTKAADGMELPLYASYYARTADGLPDEKQLTADTREMIAMLAKLRIAPLVDPFSGPAILSGRAAGVFFHEIFGHRVEGSRQKNADDGQTFAKSVEMPVLPSFLSVVFDPTQRKIGNTDLVGHYLYDDEGVKARKVTVVDKGVLKTFLLGRAPLLAVSTVERPRPRAARLPADVPSVESDGRIDQDGHAGGVDGPAASGSAPAGQTVRPALREHRGRLHVHRSVAAQRLQRAGRTSSIASTRMAGRPSSCAAST